MKDVSIKCSACRLWTLQMTMLFDIMQTSSQLFKWSLAFAPITCWDASCYLFWHLLHAFIYMFVALLKLITAIKFLSELCRSCLTFDKIHFEIYLRYIRVGQSVCRHFSISNTCLHYCNEVIVGILLPNVIMPTIAACVINIFIVLHMLAIALVSECNRSCSKSILC